MHRHCSLLFAILCTAVLVFGGVVLVTAVILSNRAHAQNAINSAQPIIGQIQNRSTLNQSVSIASSGVFQVLLSSITSAQAASLRGFAPVRQELTIANNNGGTTVCYVFLGSGTATTTSSYALPPGAVYQRAWPFVPSDQVQATCAGNNASVYVDSE